ncbi:MAG: hypothetical protein ABSB42_18740 [Tepidisphaeraceae bacterium]
MIGALICLAACASTQQLTVQANAPFKNVWQACIDALPDAGFVATSTDLSSGLIIAEKPVGALDLEMDPGEKHKLNISVFDKTTGTQVVVRFIPASGATGGQGSAQEYIAALKKRIPGIEPVIAQ